MEEHQKDFTQKYIGDMTEDSKSTNMDEVSSSDEVRQKEDDAKENMEPITTAQTQNATVDQQNIQRAEEESLDSKDTSIGTDGDIASEVDSALPPEEEDLLKAKEIQQQQQQQQQQQPPEQQRNTTETIGPSFPKPTVPGITGGLAEDGTAEDQTHDIKDEQGDGQNTELEKVTKDKNTETVGDMDTTSSLIRHNREDDQIDSHKAGVQKESQDFEGTNAESDNKRCASGDMGMPMKEEEQEDKEEKKEKEEEMTKHITDAETIHHGYEETTGSTLPEVPRGATGKWYWLIAVLTVAFAVAVAMLLQHILKTEPPPHTNDVRQIDIFLRELEKVKSQFPSQRAELWNRSRIHLQRHLQTAQPTEPVSLILTSGLRAEKTMQCLAQGLASAFSSALNASVLQIDGVSQSSQDSDKVKLDIDQKLQGAFEGDKPVAVIHRFEELPPGSTLIFYRYCDHEHAAYKKTFLIFTVLLGEEEEIPAKIRLSTVEEMVDDHLQKKFLSHSRPVSFDVMDLDKYGGLWSRISHLILPVAAEETLERKGCKNT